MLPWQRTRGTSFKQVYTLLKNVYYRYTEKPKEIYIDNCCLWQKKLQLTFGTSLGIKLDLFHVKKRFTKELPKYSNSKGLLKLQRRLPFYFPRKQRFWERQTESNADERENDWKARTFKESLVECRVQLYIKMLKKH